jgi:hypothetical protein
MAMAVKLLASGVAAVAAIGAAAVSMTPVAMASTGQAGVQMPLGTRGLGPYAQDMTRIPLSGSGDGEDADNTAASPQNPADGSFVVVGSHTAQEPEESAASPPNTE